MEPANFTFPKNNKVTNSISTNVFKFVTKADSTNKPTICFATMCKNEEHCIKETLESVYKYIDYWVVCDTGSTDKTCEIITTFFKEKNIPGDLYIDEWKGFDHNKTILFNNCYKKADYILHLDADDLLEGDFKFTSSHAGCLSYLCWAKRGLNSSMKYKVQIMFNNHYHWKFCGVAHTTIKCLDNNENLQMGYLTDQEFFLNSRDTGNRSTDPEKYYKDALILKAQFFNTLIDDPDGLNYRSVFYMANSYRDAHKIEEAAQWYSLYIKLENTWNEEKYLSYLNLANMLILLKHDTNKIINIYKDAINTISDRAEAYLNFGKFLNNVKKFQDAYDILTKGKMINLEDSKNKYGLFVHETSYGKYINDELAVSCYWLGNYAESKMILENMLSDPDFKNHKERLEKNLEYANNNL
jgi:hypothetical protein